MVLLRTAIKQGLRIAGRIDKKYNINKIFVDKYVPPGYRKTVNRIFDIGLTASGGYGIYNAINSLIAEDTPGNRAQIPFKKFTPSYRQSKTRSGRTGRFDSRYSTRQYFHKGSRCPSPRKYKRSSYR